MAAPGEQITAQEGIPEEEDMFFLAEVPDPVYREFLEATLGVEEPAPHFPGTHFEVANADSVDGMSLPEGTSRFTLFTDPKTFAHRSHFAGTVERELRKDLRNLHCQEKKRGAIADLLMDSPKQIAWQLGQRYAPKPFDEKAETEGGRVSNPYDSEGGGERAIAPPKMVSLLVRNSHWMTDKTGKKLPILAFDRPSRRGEFGTTATDWLTPSQIMLGLLVAARSSDSVAEQVTIAAANAYNETWAQYAVDLTHSQATGETRVPIDQEVSPVRRSQALLWLRV
jgi:hypothetical protein